MGSHLLPTEQGCLLRLPCHICVYRLCHTGAVGDERNVPRECAALEHLGKELSPIITHCSGVMARLVWARVQPTINRYITPCLFE